MANKPQGKSWNEIQMAITAIAVTASLGFWNLFATPEKAQAAAKVVESSTPPPPPPPTDTATVTAEPTETAMSLRPVKIIFGGEAPKVQVVQVFAPGVPATKKKGGGGGGGGGGAPVVSGGGGGGGGAPAPAPAPAPPPSTGSSKP